MCGGGRGAFLLFREPCLHGGVAADGEGAAAEEEDEAPGEEMGDDEERGRNEGEIDEDGGGKDFI